MQKPQLVVRLRGSTTEELQRAGVAAMTVFGKHGVTPLRAAETAFAREGWDMLGFDPDYEGYDAEDAAIADVWQEAAEAAAQAGCADWPAGAQPDYAEMEIMGFDEEIDQEDDDDEDDETAIRRMIAIDLASRTGREPSEAELDAEYEALVAEMNKAARKGIA